MKTIIISIVLLISTALLIYNTYLHYQNINSLISFMIICYICVIIPMTLLYCIEKYEKSIKI